ncbi:hypothetical protein ABR738_36965 [Streptomyces sp. Edi4]|uniref:hypothetical protein n=1 Tax=Streptomyces sp. Edi4 TaxID=3162527 RepID=UPI0033056D21
MFNRIGERNPNRTIPRLMELTRHLWEGERQKAGHHRYDGRIPTIATGLKNLSQHGPTGAVFLRFGRDHMEPLRGAIGNPRREAADTRAREETARAQREYQAKVQRAAQEQAAKKVAEREARRPVCADCGAKFTDARWEAAQVTDWGTPDSHPHLCDTCKQKSGPAAGGTAAGPQEHQEQERADVEQHGFRRNTRRPVCTQCGGDFANERWRATERDGWGSTSQEPRPTLGGDCDRRHSRAELEEAWPGATLRDQDQEQGQSVPEQKATGWFSRLRR